jgi:hypothetical protein
MVDWYNPGACARKTLQKNVLQNSVEPHRSTEISHMRPKICYTDVQQSGGA